MPIDTKPATSLVIIGIDWPDEELLFFLCKSDTGDPLPANVVTDIDPFAIEPWDARGDTWFLGNFGDHDCSGKDILRQYGGGYWKQLNNNTQISWGIIGEGAKIFWEFYVGHEPSGDRTGWQMLEYHMKQRKEQEANHAKENEFSSLCRIYLKDIDALTYKEENGHFGGDESKADDLEAELLRLCENEATLSELAKKCQVPPGEELGPLSEAGRKKKENSYNNADMHAPFDCSSEDFLELEDFKNNLSPSSSSDDSSCTSGTFDECFDAMALLHDLGSENVIPIESREISNHSLAMNHEVIKPPLPALSQEGINDLHGEDMASTSAPTALRKVEIVTPLSSVPQSNGTMLASGSGETSRLKRVASRSSEGSGSSRGSRRSSTGTGSSHGSGIRSPVGRIKRLGKKYCCMSPF